MTLEPRISRRSALLTLAIATVAACDAGTAGDAHPGASYAAPDMPLSARFAYPNGRTVQLDYLDRRNFRLADDTRSSETLAIEGDIYLHIWPSSGRGEQLWRFGSLRALEAHSVKSAPLKFQPTLIPPQGLAHWDTGGEVFDVTIPAMPDALAAPVEATVARMPGLARAQWVIAASLAPAMNMSLCGDAVAQITRSWSASLTAEGWAVLATSDGFRLDEKIGGLGARPTLAKGVPIQEFPFS